MAVTSPGDLVLRGQIPYFLYEYLGRPASALPKNSLWVVNFEGLGEIRPALKNAAKLERTSWNIDKNLDLLVNTTDYKSRGCLFVHAVQVPGDSFVANPEGIQQQNFVRTFVGGGRDAFTNIQITFLDTNASFVENVIRPWVLATARYGMKARSDNKKYRVDFTIYKLGVISSVEPPIILQKYTFFGACPISVTAEEYNYVGSTSPVLREASFVFNDYYIETTDSFAGNNANPDLKNMENFPKPPAQYKYDL